MIAQYDIKDKVVKPTVPDSARVVASHYDLEKLGKYIDGAEQTVNYYRLIVDKNDLNTTLDPNLPVSEQQYYLYKDTNIRVTTPLEVDSLMELSGEAILPKDITPVVGDYLTMRLLDGSIGLFRVYEIDYKSYNKNRRYLIRYKIDTTDKINNNRYQNLLSKVVKEFQYINSEDSVSGEKVLTNKDYEFELWLNYQYDNLFRIYKDRYLDKEIKYFVNDIDDIKYYDPYVTELLSYLVTLDTNINVNIINNEVIEYLLNPSKDILKDIKFYITTKELPVFIRLSMRLNERLPAKISKLITIENTGTLLTVNSDDNTLFPSLDNIFNLDIDSKFTFLLNSYLDNDVLDRGVLNTLVDYAINSKDDKSMYWYIPYLILFIKYSRERNYSVIDI